MMTCEHALTQIHNLLDGTLGSEDSIRLHAHLDDCPACRREYKQLTATQRLLKQVAPPPDAEARDRVMARFRHAAGVTPSGVSRPAPVPVGRWFAPSLALAGACAALWLAFLNTRPLPQGPQHAPHPIQVAQLTPLPDSAELAEISHLHAAQSAVALGEGAEIHEDAMLDAGAALPPTDNKAGENR